MADWMWTADAERVSDCAGIGLLGEADDGEFYVRRYQDPWVGIGWWRRFSPRNPLHWLAYWRSRRRNELVMLEVIPRG